MNFYKYTLRPRIVCIKILGREVWTFCLTIYNSKLGQLFLKPPIATMLCIRLWYRILCAATVEGIWYLFNALWRGVLFFYSLTAPLRSYLTVRITWFKGWVREYCIDRALAARTFYRRLRYLYRTFYIFFCLVSQAIHLFIYLFYLFYYLLYSLFLVGDLFINSILVWVTDPLLSPIHRYVRRRWIRIRRRLHLLLASRGAKILLYLQVLSSYVRETIRGYLFRNYKLRPWVRLEVCHFFAALLGYYIIFRFIYFAVCSITYKVYNAYLSSTVKLIDNLLFPNIIDYWLLTSGFILATFLFFIKFIFLSIFRLTALVSKGIYSAPFMWSWVVSNLTTLYYFIKFLMYYLFWGTLLVLVHQLMCIWDFFFILFVIIFICTLLASTVFGIISVLVFVHVVLSTFWDFFILLNSALYLCIRGKISDELCLVILGYGATLLFWRRYEMDTFRLWIRYEISPSQDYNYITANEFFSLLPAEERFEFVFYFFIYKRRSIFEQYLVYVKYAIFLYFYFMLKP